MIISAMLFRKSSFESLGSFTTTRLSCSQHRRLCRMVVTTGGCTSAGLLPFSSLLGFTYGSPSLPRPGHRSLAEVSSSLSTFFAVLGSWGPLGGAIRSGRSKMPCLGNVAAAPPAATTVDGVTTAGARSLMWCSLRSPAVASYGTAARGCYTSYSSWISFLCLRCTCCTVGSVAGAECGVSRCAMHTRALLVRKFAARSSRRRGPPRLRHAEYCRAQDEHVQL